MVKIKIRKTSEGDDILIRHTKFRNCRREDFNLQGLNNTNSDQFKQSNIQNRFCPDFSDIDDLLKIKNNYGDTVERVNFSIEIVKQRAPIGWK